MMLFFAFACVLCHLLWGDYLMHYSFEEFQISWSHLILCYRYIYISINSSEEFQILWSPLRRYSNSKFPAFDAFANSCTVLAIWCFNSCILRFDHFMDWCVAPQAESVHLDVTSDFFFSKRIHTVWDWDSLDSLPVWKTYTLYWYPIVFHHVCWGLNFSGSRSTSKALSKPLECGKGLIGEPQVLKKC